MGDRVFIMLELNGKRMSEKKAFLFDLNGTMIDDMQYHIKAWHGILNGLGANISLERMKEECYGKNDELLERMFPGRFSEDEKREMSYEKERHYQLAFKPHLKLLPGLDAFLEKAHQQEIKMAIGSAAIMFNIDFVVEQGFANAGAGRRRNLRTFWAVFGVRQNFDDWH